MGAQLTPEIIKALKVPTLRGYALRIIDRFGSEAKSAVPDLIELLKQPDLDPQLRRETHFALGQIGPASAPATPHLIAALGSDNERIRNSALFALGRIGPGAYTAVPTLEKLSGVEDEFLRVASLWALVGIEPGDAALAAKATPELIKGLSSEREVVRLESSRTLGALGPAAKQALPALRPLVDDPSAAVAGTAAQAIEAIEGRKLPAGGAPSGATPAGSAPTGSAPAGSAPAGSATPGSGAPAGAPAPGASGRSLPARQPASAPRPGR
jgi:HEAT repeat protein